MSKTKESAEERERRIGGYDLPLDADMTNMGWAKSLTWKYLTVREDKTILCEEYDFYVKDQMHQCGSQKFLWLVPDRTLILACTYCQTAETISRDAGIKRKEYIVSPQTAIQIMKDRGFRENQLPMRVFMKLARKTARTFVPRDRPKKSK